MRRLVDGQLARRPLAGRRFARGCAGRPASGQSEHPTLAVPAAFLPVGRPADAVLLRPSYAPSTTSERDARSPKAVQPNADIALRKVKSGREAWPRLVPTVFP